MSKTYMIKRFAMMKVSELSPHPEALIPIDDEDSWAICESVKELGAVMDPLLVVLGAGGKAGVVDGCNRLAAAEVAGLDEVPCLVIETDDVKRLVMEHLGARRKGSTGQRIMAYLETHRREVLKVAEIMADGHGNSVKQRDRVGHVTGPVIPKNLEHFTAVAIAEKLRVSAKDVGLGIELLQCMEKKLRPSRLLGTDLFPAKPLDMDDQEDKDYLESMRQVRDRLFMGASPIRRWKAACGGISKTADKERPEIQYGVLASKAMATLMNAFKHWEDISSRERQVLADRWDKVMTAARKANLNG